jgi:transposase-like protein
MGNNGKRYDTEFRADATRLVKENGRSVASVAKDLGINPQTLRNWLGEDKKRQSPDKARIMELEAELRAEKRRNTDLEEIHKLDENTFIIEGHTSLERVKNYLNLDLPIDEYETLSGFIIGQLGRIPGPDDKPTLEFDGVIFKVQEVCEKRIAKVKACKV